MLPDLLPQCTHKLVPRRTDLLTISDHALLGTAGAVQLHLQQQLHHSQQQAACGASGAAAAVMGFTTVMIKNIPNRYTQATLLAEIDALGFTETYDFCHMPIDMVNSCNVGYAFVNFARQEICQAFVQIMHDYRFRTFRSRKLGACVPAHIQGLENNLRHFSKTRVMGWEKFRPFVRISPDNPLALEFPQFDDLHHHWNASSSTRTTSEFSEQDLLPPAGTPSEEVQALADILRRCLNLCNANSGSPSSSSNVLVHPPIASP